VVPSRTSLRLYGAGAVPTSPTERTLSFQWKSYLGYSSRITAAEKSLSGTLQSGWDYGYDPAGNITTVQNSSGSTATVSNRSHKSTNQIDTIGGGPTLVRGTLIEPGQVSVGIVGSGDKPARMLADNRFETELPLAAGPNALSIAASDTSGNRSTYRFDVRITNPSPRTLSYKLRR